jgi:N-methylhydantoinase A
MGQTHELNVRLPQPYDDEAHQGLETLVAQEHRREFGHAPPAGTPIELVNLRVSAIGRIDRPSLPAVASGSSPVPVAHRRAWIGGWVEAPIYARDSLAARGRIEGPAIVEQMDATTLIPPAWAATVDHLGSLVLRPSGGRR